MVLSSVSPHKYSLTDCTSFHPLSGLCIPTHSLSPGKHTVQQARWLDLSLPTVRSWVVRCKWDVAFCLRSQHQWPAVMDPNLTFGHEPKHVNHHGQQCLTRIRVQLLCFGHRLLCLEFFARQINGFPVNSWGHFLKNLLKEEYKELLRKKWIITKRIISAPSPLNLFSLPKHPIRQLQHKRTHTHADTLSREYKITPSQIYILWPGLCSVRVKALAVRVTGLYDDDIR